MESGHRWGAYGFYPNGQGPPRKASFHFARFAVRMVSLAQYGEHITDRPGSKGDNGPWRQQDKMGKGPGKQSVVELKDT